MLVSMSFSVIIYRVLTAEFTRLQRVEKIRIQRGIPNLPIFIDNEVIIETKNRIALNLFSINLVIFGASAVAGYFLAGRTLKPISDMMDEQNRFISDASHELRTPLTALKSEIEVNLRSNNLTLVKSKKLLQSNLEEVNNLQALSDNLIKLTGNNNLSIEHINLAGVIKDATRRVSVAAKMKHIKITSEISNISLNGNALLLTELFIILLDNAVKYSAGGKSIHITAKKDDGHVSIRITDHGYGIHREDIPHIFDRFWRADKSRTKSDVSGYGLGLAIAKQIVERHDGSIDVESIPGKGTTFTISLPE